ncbi:endocellulase [Gloeopeniophorella convolvens]|nr:endocellulase [Gloeopeniophorella convolvens]
MVFALALGSQSRGSCRSPTITGQYDCLPAGTFTLCQNLWGICACRAFAASRRGGQNSTLVSTQGDAISWQPIGRGRTDRTTSKAVHANVLSNTALGVQLGNVASAPTAWNWTYITESEGIRADVSYDIWFGVAPQGTAATSASSYEIMIWLSGLGGIQPVGSQITTATPVGGHTWNLWKGPNANWEVFSFVSSTGNINNFQADLKDFFDYLVSEQGVASTQYVQAIQTGTEAFTGSASLSIDSFSVSLNAN